MKRRGELALALLALAAILVFLYLTNRRQNPAPPPPIVAKPDRPDQAGSLAKPAPPRATDAPTSAGSPQPALDALSAAPRMKPPPAPAPAAVAETAESVSLPPRTILENMGRTIQQYASMFGENPVGTNPEITSALQGDNPKHINFLKADGNRVNSQGELVDAWGTPYFFHQISGHEMEIRSAGPDRVMYTGDDLVTR